MERRFVDLHTHSTASDGQFAPAELVRTADKLKLAAIAITDHDTTAGLAEARAAASELPQLKFIPGIEVSSQFPTGTLHILGLDIDDTSAPLAEALAELRAARDERNPRVIERLRELGLDISMEDVLREAGGGGPGHVVGRLHIAQALVRKRYVAAHQEAFARYLGAAAPAYVDKERFSPRRAIEAIHAAGGLAMLAHPPQLKCENRAQLERVVRELVHAGLDGIEVYHSQHTPEQTRHYLDLTRSLNLSVSGGSDFHGGAKPDVQLGLPRVPVAALTGRLAKIVGR